MARYDDQELGDHVVREYTAGMFFNHSPAEAATFFAGLDLIEPGLTNGRTWRAETPGHGIGNGEVYALAGVGRKL